MAYFRRDNRSGGGGRFGGGFNRREGRREMHKAVCSNCGRECEVPFKPTGSKPVYCSDCFEKQDNRDSRSNRFDRPPRNSNFGSGNNNQQPSNDQFKELNSKLDKIIYLLQSQTSKKQEDVKISEAVTIDDIIKSPEDSQVKPTAAPKKRVKKSKKAESETYEKVPAGDTEESV